MKGQVVKYSKWFASSLMIITHITYAYYIFDSIINEEKFNKENLDFENMNSDKFDCYHNLITNTCFAIMLAFLWNSKKSIHIGII